MTAPEIAICLPATVDSVHDGDTATVTLKITTQVRYLKCWAPELKDAGGKESAARAKEAEGKHGRLFIPIDGAKTIADLLTFGRVLGELWIDGESESESQKQVRLKMAATAKGKPLGT
jgi:endonuclease YncB( thermonuclease family)